MKMDLGKDGLWRLILKYGIPSVLTMWIFSLYTIVDGFFVSKYLGSQGLAAVNIVMPYINLSFAMGIMVAIGGATIIGIKLGEQKEKEASRVYSISVELFIILGLIIGAVGIIFSKEVVNILGANSIIENDSMTYLYYLSFFVVFYLLGYGLEIFVRVDGNPTYSMICILIGAVVNILLDYILIAKLQMGIAGAALATGTAQMSTVLPLIYYLKYKRKKLKFKIHRIDYKLSWNILFNGSSEFLTEIATGIVIMAFNIHIMSTIGNEGVSAFGIIGYISTLVTMTMIGFAQGIQPIISYNYGAEYFNRIKEILKISLGTVLILGAVFYIGVNVFSENIVHIFVRDNEKLISITKEAIKFYSFTYIIMGINIIVGAYFTAVEDALTSSILSILRGIIFINILLYILPNIFENKGIWISAPLNETITLVISMMILFTTGIKKLKTVE
ncbi:MAG: MATE family efflux transporter [Cetobacterium sp.]|uniref:MATE family efflux transporter n=1 Tax=Cetobacterium sp. TaxID=2071632 RepID=UPI003F414C0F